MVVIESTPTEPSAPTPARSQCFEKSVIIIGRFLQADVCLVSDRIFCLAIRIMVTAEDIVLEDASENGSTLNGVHGWGTRPIREGDDIRIGPYRLTIRRTA